MGQDQAQHRQRRRHRREQLAGRVDGADRDGPAQQRGQQPGDHTHALSRQGTPELPDANDQRHRRERSEHAHAAIAADHRDLEQADEQGRAIEPVGAVQRAVTARPPLRDVRDAAFVEAERGRRVRGTKQQGEQQTSAEPPPGPPTVGERADTPEADSQMRARGKGSDRHASTVTTRREAIGGQRCGVSCRFGQVRRPPPPRTEARLRVEGPLA